MCRRGDCVDGHEEANYLIGGTGLTDCWEVRQIWVDSPDLGRTNGRTKVGSSSRIGDGRGKWRGRGDS